jgi:predicted ATPase
MQPPFLSSLKIETPDVDIYPYNIPVLKSGVELHFKNVVTFIVGENGSGKSTILEVIAAKCNYNLGGGNKNHYYEHYKTEANLYDNTTLSWHKKPFDGFFLRAESFYNFAEYVDELAKESYKALDAYGGKSLHHQSHGESFLSLFANKFDRGFFILDEPEAALSPMRQLSLLSIINELENNGNVQFIIATHSPILICYPGATIYNIIGSKIEEVEYKDTEHYKTTKEFLDAPESFFKHLFKHEQKHS